jgi:hypothetical protein
MKPFKPFETKKRNLSMMLIVVEDFDDLAAVKEVLISDDFDDDKEVLISDE